MTANHDKRARTGGRGVGGLDVLPGGAVRADAGQTSVMDDVIAWCKEHKLRAIGGVWVTGMAGSMAYNATQTHLRPMVKLIHSRVYAQALTIGCLVGSAAAEFYDQKYNARVEEVDPHAYKPPVKSVKGVAA